MTRSTRFAPVTRRSARHFSPSRRWVRNLSILLFVLLLASLLPLPVSAQVTTGTPPFGSFSGGPDITNNANLNVHLTIPVLHKPGRGTNFAYDIGYDSSVWYPVGSSGNQSWQPVSATWGWQGLAPGGNSYITYAMTYSSNSCWNGGPTSYQQWSFSNFVYVDPFGVGHYFGYSPVYFQSPGGANCPPNGPQPSTPQASYASDGSGYTLYATPGSGYATAYIVASNGAVINPPVGSTPPGSQGSSSTVDRNGNTISSNNGVYTDTLGTTALTVAGTAPSDTTFTFTPPAGGSTSYTVKYSSYTVQTAFGCGITEYPPTSTNLVSEIRLPDWNATTNPNSRYVFGYESTPGHSGSVTGRIASVQLPTGGTISYTYTGGNNGIVCADGSTAGLQRSTPDTGANYWNYARSGTAPATTTTITDPLGNNSVIQFQGIYETQRDVYQGSIAPANLLKTIMTCYNGSASPCTTTAVALPISQRSETIQLGTLQCKHVRFWNSFGMPTEADDYDYGSGSPGALLTKTLITYASLGNITAFQQRVTVCNGSGTSSSCTGPSGSSTGTVVAQTNYNYDENTPATSNGVAQHTSVSGSRGNLTSINYPVSGLTSHFTYWDTGSPNTSQDVNGATTTYNYSSNTASCQMAFPTSISEPLNMSRSFAWNCTGGVITQLTDENSQVTSTTYNDPYFWRPASVTFPDTGQTSWTYNSPTSITTTTKMNASQNVVSTLLLDGLGRTSQTQLNSDPQGVDYTDTTYDALGRVATISNPHRSTSSSTDGTTCYGTLSGGVCQKNGYDALGRVTNITLQDGSVVSASYSNNTATATDPAGKTRQSTVNSLGRLTQVTEDPGGLGYVSTYGYDALSNLVSVVQNGGRQRTFVYDAMSRLTSETNPESGTVTYGYDAGTNKGDLTSRVAPAPNQTGTATVTTTYSWDLLHRLTQKSYSDGTTPTAAYLYDVSSTNGVTISNPVGRLVRGTTNNCIQTINSYDAMGRTTTQWLNTPSYCGPASFIPSYTYDLAGNMLSASNGVGVTISYAYNTAARPTSVTSSMVDSQHPATLATVDSTLGYYPHGAILKMTFGNGLTQATEVERRFQPCQINLNSSGSVLSGCGVTPPSGTVQDYHYTYGTWGSTNSGNVTNLVASGTQAFNRDFSYDSLNRLATLNQSSGNATGCSATFNLSWSYDAWGNRSDQNVTSGTCNAFHASINTQNQLSGSPYQYDGAGNMTHDASHAYFYDAENRLIQVDGTLGTCSTATVCYQYDAFGLRAESNHGSWQMDYIHDLSGNVVADWETSSGYTGWATGYVYLNGGLLAQYQGSTTHFAHADHLGSTHLLTGLDQSVVQNLDFLPFGELNSSDSGINNHEFTGDERDSETGLDHTWFRQYSSPLGRWMHPDPAGLAAVDITNPQSWNRYSYVLNSPLNLVDPLGLNDCEEHADCGDGGWWTGPQAGQDLFGGFDFSDPLGCRALDFWGGDCIIENRMALRAAGIISSFDIAELMNMAYAVFPIRDGRIDFTDPKGVIYPFAGLQNFLWYDSTGRGGGGASGASAGKILIQQQVAAYSNCVTQGTAAIKDQEELQIPIEAQMAQQMSEANKQIYTQPLPGGPEPPAAFDQISVPNLEDANMVNALINMFYNPHARRKVAKACGQQYPLINLSPGF
jgi:RHS repeat-associated protein